MGIPVLILGESGSGKSASLRNFLPSELGVLNVAGKPLPFKAGRMFKKVENATYDQINAAVTGKTFKVYVVDDSQYLMAFESFDKAKVTGFGKFTDMASNFYHMLRNVTLNTPADTVVYFLHHVEDTASGKMKAKTIGKMLDDQLTIEGLFSIVLGAKTQGGQYKFLTQTDGTIPAKSPMEMFDDNEIDNDLYYVDTKIREYYGFKPLREENKSEEIKND